LGQQVVTGGVHHRNSCWEAFAQHFGDSLLGAALEHPLNCCRQTHGYSTEVRKANRLPRLSRG
jgi:hypothetical protein